MDEAAVFESSWQKKERSKQAGRKVSKPKFLTARRADAKKKVKRLTSMMDKGTAIRHSVV